MLLYKKLLLMTFGTTYVVRCFGEVQCSYLQKSVQTKRQSWRLGR